MREIISKARTGVSSTHDFSAPREEGCKRVALSRRPSFFLSSLSFPSLPGTESEQNQQHPLHVRIRPLSDESVDVVLDALNGFRGKVNSTKMKVNGEDEYLRGGTRARGEFHGALSFAIFFISRERGSAGEILRPFIILGAASFL